VLITTWSGGAGAVREPIWLRGFRVFIPFLVVTAVVIPARSSVAQILDPRSLQESLVWVGFYVGPLDGQLGPASLSAIQNFQRSINHPATGALSTEETQFLIQRAAERRNESGFKYVRDGTTPAHSC
jgi:serine protease Do